MKIEYVFFILSLDGLPLTNGILEWNNIKPQNVILPHRCSSYWN